MKFKPGDKVVFLHDRGGGKIVAILSKSHVRIEDEFGFERDYPINALAAVVSQNYVISEQAVQAKESEKQPKSRAKADALHEITVDLHIEQLVPAHGHMTNGEILQLQMDHFRKMFRHAIAKRIKRIKVIHGVGEGVLRGEIHQFLRGYDSVEFHDMTYTRNGFGGTEVILYFKGLIGK
jgi:dsDNA-specific endonuclease/ATPase MutS2